MEDVKASKAGSSNARSKGGKPKKKISIRDSDKKAKRMTPQYRQVSPSEFLMDESAAMGYVPKWLHGLENRQRIERVVRAVADMYYPPNEPVNRAQLWGSGDFSHFEFRTLEVLQSDLRVPNPLDNWSPKEIALFEAGVCAYGKEFHSVQKMVQTKTVKEIVDFYYVWKRTAHYHLWKHWDKPTRKPHVAKEEQWRLVAEKYEGKTDPFLAVKVEQEGSGSGTPMQLTGPDHSSNSNSNSAMELSKPTALRPGATGTGTGTGAGAGSQQHLRPSLSQGSSVMARAPSAGPGGAGAGIKPAGSPGLHAHAGPFLGHGLSLGGLPGSSNSNSSGISSSNSGGGRR